jgi:hypothetical protein
LNETPVALAKPVPPIVTAVPAGPELGVKDVIVGVAVTVNAVELVAVPALVVTEIGPVVALCGTVAVIRVDESTVYVALTPLNARLETFVKFVPAIVTAVPSAPAAGPNDVIVGLAGATELTVKSVALCAVPEEVVTVIFPVAAPDGTAAWICPAETTLYTACTPPNVTELAAVKPVPLIVTVVPGPPVDGENDVIDGGWPVTTKSVVLVAVPPLVVTVMRPVTAPAGTAVWICVVEMTFAIEETPENATVAPLAKFEPVIVTAVPGAPEDGEKEVMAGPAGGGGGVTVKLPLLAAVPVAVVTEIAPVVALTGTVAVICVELSIVNAALAPLNDTPVAPLKFVPVIVTDVPDCPDVGVKDVIVGGEGAGGGGAGTGVVATIHGAGGVLSPARKASVPCSAAVAPSQCCTNEIDAVLSVPSDANVAELTVNDPVSVLHPRPSPETSRPGPLPLKG